jgi:hypothetical protein
VRLERCLGTFAGGNHYLFLHYIGHIPGGEETGHPRFIGTIYLNLTEIIQPGYSTG